MEIWEIISGSLMVKGVDNQGPIILSNLTEEYSPMVPTLGNKERRFTDLQVF